MSSASPPPPVAPIEHGEVLSPEQVEARAKVERLSTWLDTKFRIPGTNIRFGADAVAGVIPGVGDTAGMVASAVVIAQAVAVGARGWTLTRMVVTASIDALVGTVPVAGTVFDVVFKANTRNVALLDRHIAAPTATRAASRRSVAATAAVIAATMFLTVVGTIAVLVVLFQTIT